MFKTSAFDIWRQEEQTPKIITLCRGLDDHLNGGIGPGITEFCGASGTAKTQFCLQLCVNVQFPKEVGGVGGKAFFVDTNQGFHPRRLEEIAVCTDERFQRTFKKTQLSPETTFNSNSILANVAYTNCESHEHLLATVFDLKAHLNREPALKLIIIDSFAFLLRRIEDIDQRSEIIYDLLTDLRRLAMDFQIAIVITNELTTRLTSNKQWHTAPALGDSHSHCINQRIVLRRQPPDSQTPFEAILEKSVVAPRLAIPFTIKQSGIRGVS